MKETVHMGKARKHLPRVKIVTAVFVFLVVLFASGAIYQWCGASVDRKSYKPTGTLYTVDGKKMHIYAGGNKDSGVTVVFAAGWGTANPYADFYPLYDGVSQFTRFAVYDKFGYGFSDITDKPRDIDVNVEEIHDLLTVSKQQAPYIVVGHSMASLEVIRYAQKFPDEVKGIVLIDGGNPELYAKTTPATLFAVMQRQLVDFGIARILYQFPGFVDSLNSDRNELRFLPSTIKKLDETATLLVADNKNVLDEMREIQKNANKVIAGGGLKDIPLIILTADGFGETEESWLKSQQELASWSTNSSQFVVRNSRHYIHQYQPEIILREIEELVNGK